jgi:hypothetical protein
MMGVRTGGGSWARRSGAMDKRAAATAVSLQDNKFMFDKTWPIGKHTRIKIEARIFLLPFSRFLPRFQPDE